MRIVILTGDKRRHHALVSCLARDGHNICAVYIESGYTPPLQENQFGSSEIIRYHFSVRDVSEEKVFGSLASQMESQLKRGTDVKYVRHLSLRGDEFCDQISQLAPDLIVVYGTSIIKGKLISAFEGRILNLHLGLSPYYRGSGTLFFPFVNNEHQYAGATFMLLDEGIDTGPILHQEAMHLDVGENFHDNCNNFIYRTFEIYSALICCSGLERLDMKRSADKFIWTQEPRRYYKDSDFNEETLLHMQKNYGVLQSAGPSLARRTNPVIFKSTYI